MSHITSIFTAIKDIFVLRKALEELNLSYELNSKIYSESDQVDVDLLIKLNNGQCIGLNEDIKNNCFKFVADEKVLKNNSKIIEKITQKYSYLKIKDDLFKKGYLIEKEEILPNNEIKIVFYKWK